MDADSPNRQTSRGLVVPWGWLSLGLTVVTISSLGTLAVIAKRESADTLSTIAIALAVLSFSAQLIVSLAQAFNGTQQVAQADRVNADTRASLAAISATSEALLANQRGQFSEVLHAALKIAVPAAVQDVEEAGSGNDIDSPQIQVSEDSIKNLEERLSVRISEALRDIRTGYVPPTGARTGIRQPSAIEVKMTTYPDETRGPALLNMFEKMTPQESALFTKWATRTLRYAENAEMGSIPSFAIYDPPSDELGNLIKLCLVRAKKLPKPDGSSRDRYILTLTDLGLELAGLILGRGPKPSWMNATE